MEHHESPVEERRRRAEDPARISVAEPGPASTRSHQNVDTRDSQSAQWRQLMGWRLPLTISQVISSTDYPQKEIIVCLPISVKRVVGIAMGGAYK